MFIAMTRLLIDEAGAQWKLNPIVKIGGWEAFETLNRFEL